MAISAVAKTTSGTPIWYSASYSCAGIAEFPRTVSPHIQPTSSSDAVTTLYLVNAKQSSPAADAMTPAQKPKSLALAVYAS